MCSQHNELRNDLDVSSPNITDSINISYESIENPAVKHVRYISRKQLSYYDRIITIVKVVRKPSSAVAIRQG